MLQISNRTVQGYVETEVAMIDLLYVLLTVAFFALMVGYVRACERLGEESGEESRK